MFLVFQVSLVKAPQWPLSAVEMTVGGEISVRACDGHPGPRCLRRTTGNEQRTLLPLHSTPVPAVTPRVLAPTWAELLQATHTAGRVCGTASPQCPKPLSQAGGRFREHLLHYGSLQQKGMKRPNWELLASVRTRPGNVTGDWREGVPSAEAGGRGRELATQIGHHLPVLRVCRRRGRAILSLLQGTVCVEVVLPRVPSCPRWRQAALVPAAEARGLMLDQGWPWLWLLDPP